MTKMNMEETERFIKLVSEHPALYDHKDKRFMDILLKESIWEGIAQHMKKNRMQCKRTWRSLKDSYARFKRKYERTKQIHSKSNYKIYKHMTFLDDTILASTRPSKKMPVISPRIEQKDAEDPIVVGMEHVFFNKPIKFSKDIPRVNGTVYKIVDPLSFTSQNGTNCVTTQQVIRNKQKSNPKITVIPKKLVKVPFHEVTSEKLVFNGFTISKQRDDKMEEDASITFFSTHVKEALKKLPPILQVQAKQEMFRVLTKYELMALDRDEINTSSEVTQSSSIDLEILDFKPEANLYDNDIELNYE